MATPRPLEKYPSEFHAVFRRAVQGPVEIKLGSSENAKRMRHRLYAYRQSLKHAEGKVAGYEDIMLIAPLASLYIEGSSVILSYPEQINEHASANIRPST